MNKDLIIEKYKELVELLDRTSSEDFAMSKSLRREYQTLKKELKALESESLLQEQRGEKELCPICESNYLTDRVCLSCTKTLCTPFTQSGKELREECNHPSDRLHGLNGVYYCDKCRESFSFHLNKGYPPEFCLFCIEHVIIDSGCYVEKETEKLFNSLPELFTYWKVPCYACQGGGCPVCSGTGYLIQ